MAFEIEMAAILPMVRALCPSGPEAGLLLSIFTRASHAPRDRTVEPSAARVRSGGERAH